MGATQHQKDLLRWSSKIEIDSKGCWLWQGELRKGYGRFKIGRRKVSAHIYGFQSIIGPIPPGLKLDHKCRVPACVNPDHSEPVTQRENVLRGNGIAAKRANLTTCKNGHELSGNNVRIEGKRSRRCKQCQRDYGIARRAKTP